MKLQDFRNEIIQFNKNNPTLKNCIYQGCKNKINPQWDNDVLCREHILMHLYWFYELDGARYCPDFWDMTTGKKMPKPEGSDKDMTAYRKRYCNWIASLSESDYLEILKLQIGDEKPEEGID